MKFRILLILLFFPSCFLFAQERLVPLLSNPEIIQASKAQKERLKTKLDIVALHLPFFEDFSNYTGYPDSSRWLDKYAYVNKNYPLFPPTIGVATLDGLDASGMLYPQANTKASFGTDTLTSQPIRLDSLFSGTPKKLTPADSVYLSFYFQPGGGTGEPWARTGGTPNPADSLVLEFYSPIDTLWHYAWSQIGIPLDSLLAQNKGYFAYVLLPITDSIYFTNAFQFRFRTFGSLASNVKPGYNGNSAQWHLDYIEINSGRSAHDFYHTDFAFVNPAPSFLKNYQAMPARQFTSEELKDTLDITITNLYNETLSIEYGYSINASGNTVASYGNPYFVENIKPFLPDHTYQTAPRQASPPVVYTFPDLPKDGKNLFKVKHVIKQGTDIHSQNDTITFDQLFWNYYAYDDGSAENGYILETKTGISKLAYRFSLKEKDTLTSIEMYFNQTLDSGNYVPFHLIVWEDKDSLPGKELYRSSEELYPQFKQLNSYARYILDRPLLVENTIYIGFEQLSSNGINLGFDRNTNSAAHIFYKVSNHWQNSFMQGSLMMRPYFGKEGAVAGIETSSSPEPVLELYPNPVQNGRIYFKTENISAASSKIFIYDIMGRLLVEKPFSYELDVSILKSGVYILKIWDSPKNRYITKRLIIS